MRKIFQLLDDQEGPQGGHVFEAPDEASLESSIAAARQALPEGWTMAEVADEAQIIGAPAPEPPPAPVAP